MATKEELRQRQESFLAVYDDVQKELLQLPDVVGVGIGLKEVAGKLTDQICFRVYLWDKKAASEIPSEQLIPNTIKGFATDVLKVYNLKHNADFVERRDISQHRPLTGGVAISTKIMSTKSEYGEFGTLGWFAKKISDGSTVVLTNAHVLYPDLYNEMPPTVLTETDKLSQPKYDKTCCCEYNVIGERLIGIKTMDVDCGLGRINSDEAISLVIANRATTKTLKVEGTDTAIVGEKVQKIGARSGYTQGVVVDIGGAVAGPKIILPDGKETRIRPNQIIIWPADTETYVDDHWGRQIAFGNEGDSGSVVLDSENKIIGLFFSSDEKSTNKTIGIANHIALVLKNLKDHGHEIELKKSPAGGSVGMFYQTATPPKISLEGLVRESTTTVAALIRKHRIEIAELIDRCRPVTVCWQRKHGPAFVAAVLRSTREPSYVLPTEINGITRLDLLLNMSLVLSHYGSPSLKEDLGEHGLAVLKELSEADNVRSVLFPTMKMSEV